MGKWTKTKRELHGSPRVWLARQRDQRKEEERIEEEGMTAVWVAKTGSGLDISPTGFPTVVVTVVDRIKPGTATKLNLTVKP